MKNFIDSLIESNDIKVDNSIQNKNYLRQAYIYGKENSDYDGTWTGAIIEKDGLILSSGANKLPNGFIFEGKVIKGSKFENLLDHAERNAIYSAAKNGIKLEGSNIYMPWVPCVPCAIGIINSGIKSLVMHYSKVIKTPGDRVNDVRNAVNLLLESGIKLFIVNEEIGGCESKLRNEIWYP